MPQSTGDAAQTRAIVEQVAEAAFRKYAQEARGKSAKWSASAPAWAACALSIAGLVWNAAVITGNVADNQRRIEMVEAEQRQAATDNRQVIDRLARIEAKLDMMGSAK